MFDIKNMDGWLFGEFKTLDRVHQELRHLGFVPVSFFLPKFSLYLSRYG
jgi:hypothetical protein